MTEPQSDFVTADRMVGGYELVREVVLPDALNPPGDEWLAGQKLERFVGESGRA